MNVLDILNSPWAITPEKLTEMCAIYAAHRNGESANLKAIEVALGKPLGPGGAKAYEVLDGVAVLPLEGILSKRMGLFGQISGGQSYQSFQSELQQALDDPTVSAIILQIDSPGGAVDGAQQAADAVFAARSVKPICALVDGQMCSAAYWVGSSASKVYIGSDVDVVGSIGVVTQHVDTSAAEYMQGIKVTDITAGKYKRIASQHSPLSPEGRGAIQDQLDHVYGVFVDAVARNRSVAADTVVNKMADGRVFRGQQAIAAGLVDGKIALPALIKQLRGQKRGLGSFAKTSAKPADANAAAAIVTASKTNAEMATAGADSAVAKPDNSKRLSPAEIAVKALLGPKQQAVALQSELQDARRAERAAQAALSRESRSPNRTKASILTLITARDAAKKSAFELGSKLEANEREQLAILRG